MDCHAALRNRFLGIGHATITVVIAPIKDAMRRRRIRLRIAAVPRSQWGECRGCARGPAALAPRRTEPLLGAGAYS